jgi:hypothetical protein
MVSIYLFIIYYLFISTWRGEERERNTRCCRCGREQASKRVQRGSNSGRDLYSAVEEGFSGWAQQLYKDCDILRPFSVLLRFSEFRSRLS